MTGNQIKGKGFGGALRYNLEKVDKNMAEVLDHSFAHVNERSILKEVQMVKMLRPNLQKFFYHTSINFPPHEDISNRQMKQIAHDYLQANGFIQHQFIMFRHYDANHPHLHILVNRIGYDGKVLSDSNDFARSEKVLRELEKKYKLTEVVSSKRTAARAPTKNELEMMKRTNLPSKKMKLQTLIKEVLKSDDKLTISQFVKGLREKNVQPRFNMATTGYISGISYEHDGLVITGSKLGADFKWTTLKDKIAYNQLSDKTIIDSANCFKSHKATTQIPKPKIEDVLHPRVDINPAISYGKNLINAVLHAEDQVSSVPDFSLDLKRKKRRKGRWR